MKSRTSPALALLAAACSLSSARAQSLPTTGTFQSAIGNLDLVNGYPSQDTITRVFDTLDHQRACQAYLWALPIMAMQQWQQEHLTKFGAGNLDYVDYLTFKDKLGLLTSCPSRT